MESSQTPKQYKYADIGINLTDPVFHGVYHGKRAHDDDFPSILDRAAAANCSKMMVTGSTIEESKHAIEIAKENPSHCYATVGVHPCSSTLFISDGADPTALLSELELLATSGSHAGHVVAFGEIGLDYDRLFLCPKDTQLTYFAAQLSIAARLSLPLFLHSRAAAADFARLIREHLPPERRRGVVHSFTGTLAELRDVLDMGFHIGINGCSMKTEDNLDAVRAIPLERLMLETDGPWCEMRPSHASARFLKDGPPLPKSVKKEKWSAEAMVKGRNEPCTMPQVAWAVAGIKGLPVEQVVEAAWSNAVSVFDLGEKPPISR